MFVDTTAGIRRRLQTFTGEDTRCVIRTVLRSRYEHRRIKNDSQEQEKKCKKIIAVRGTVSRNINIIHTNTH